MSAPHTQHALAPEEARRRVEADARRSGVPRIWLGVVIVLTVIATVIANHLYVLSKGA